MKHVICPISYIPMRAEPSHRSEQVSQILFGETASVVEFKGSWIRITLSLDAYQGWLEANTVLSIEQDEFNSINENSFCINTLNTKARTIQNSCIELAIGSKIPYNINLFGEFSIANTHFILDEFKTLDKESNLELVVLLAKSLVNTPYLWGGKTQWGVDCSGFVQILFACLGYELPRDASMQANLGNEIDIYSTKTGDLAFFENEDGKISHVGLMLDQKIIIHASGKVRIDQLDKNGIVRSETGKYSHKLTSIKRILVQE